MSADLLFASILAVVLLFIAIWALVLGVGFVLSLRDDLARTDDFCGRNASGRG